MAVFGIEALKLWVHLSAKAHLLLVTESLMGPK
jgi:hypothetical protein